MSARAKLPIGIQSFEKIRRDGFAYVDKTAYVYEMARAGAPCFLSRPRRFGKSLLVSTMRAYFEGRRELFAGLDIERLEGDGPGAWTARPVFLLSFNGADYTREGGLEGKLDALLAGFERDWGGEDDGLDGIGFGPRFQRLLEAAHSQSGHRCAVLVDEYDKPLLEAMGDPALEERNRATLKGLYSVLKDADEHLRFAFVTGVTKFSKVSIFSDLNNLRDISLSADYAAVCGVTEPELLAGFGGELDALAAQLGLSRGGCLDALRTQYDGYCFHPDGPGGPGRETDGPGGGGSEAGREAPGAAREGGAPAGDAAGPGPEGAAAERKVYNPFSLLLALQERRLGSYWFETGTPTFLARRMAGAGLDPRRLTDGSVYATERRLSDYRADDPDPVPLLFQAGYLTIRSLEAATGEYSLAVPNGEVEWGLVESLLPAWAPGYSESRGTDVFSLRRLAEAGDTEGMRDVIAALFASIPYTRASDPFENYFQAVLWLTFTLLGRYVSCEVRQARGRVDCVVEARAHVYVIEFKRGGTAAEALGQIEERGYAAPYAADPRRVHRIGAAFDPETRLLADWREA